MYLPRLWSVWCYLITNHLRLEHIAVVLSARARQSCAPIFCKRKCQSKACRRGQSWDCRREPGTNWVQADYYIKWNIFSCYARIWVPKFLRWWANFSVNVNCTHYFSWRSHTVSAQQAVCTFVFVLIVEQSVLVNNKIGPTGILDKNFAGNIKQVWYKLSSWNINKI